MKKCAIAVLCLMFVSTAVFAAASGGGKSSASAAAKTTGAYEGQMAIGYEAGVLTGNNSAIAFRYCVNDMFSFEGLLGFGTGDALFGRNNTGQNVSGSMFAFGVKSFYIFQRYSSFNFYGTFGMSIGVLSPKGGDSSSPFGLVAGVGVEYFLARNLSLSSELGLGGTFVKDGNSFGTFGDFLPNFGLRYYFGS
ncbi:MAG: porin family protein [Endomicrobia bacterium]|nr:porin family protein [Endomicrobiia bacterium]